MLWHELGIPFDDVMGMTPADTNDLLGDLMAARREAQSSGDTYVEA